MTQSFTPSSTRPVLPDNARQTLWDDMIACRQSTLTLFEGLTHTELCQQAHPDFSPVGWHLGHIAFTESLWLLEHLKGDPCPYPQYRQLFAADGLPKAKRQNLPSLTELLVFTQEIRDRTLAYLNTAPLDNTHRLWRWLIQHESQHAETATLLLEIHRWPHKVTYSPTLAADLALDAHPLSPEMVYIPAGEVILGNEHDDALDNERPQHLRYTDAFFIDRTPVTVHAFRTFMEAGGYQNQEFWTPQGWQWRQAYGITQPRYWRDAPGWEAHPVCGVSLYEAQAYARFVNKRLPTEAEWEKAARGLATRDRPNPKISPLYPWGSPEIDHRYSNFGSAIGHTTPVSHHPLGASNTGCLDLLGNVWEWTATTFQDYPGFQAYPYRGYSQAYFDHAHWVLRGGSWATRRWALRSTFRNWYHPHVREVFAGFRCVLDASQA